MIGDRSRTIIIGVVTAVWAINFFAGLAVPGYEPSESINGIFMAIVGGLFALGARKGAPGNKGNDEVESPRPRKKIAPKTQDDTEPPPVEEDDDR